MLSLKEQKQSLERPTENLNVMLEDHRPILVAHAAACYGGPGKCVEFQTNATSVSVQLVADPLPLHLLHLQLSDCLLDALAWSSQASQSLCITCSTSACHDARQHEFWPSFLVRLSFRNERRLKVVAVSYAGAAEAVHISCGQMAPL